MRRKILSVLLCCLTLCSCGNSSDSTISITTTTTTKTESSVENATPPTDIGNEVSVGIGINYPEGATNLEFDGEKVSAEISLDCDNADTELGLLIYVEGMVQKYSVYENQEEKAMHTFNLNAGETKTVMVEFDPIVGKKGDNLNVIFGIMLNPSFVAEDENRTYGNNHKINTLGIQKLVMKADGQNSEVLFSEKYDCEEMTEEFKSKYVLFNEDGSLYRNKLEWLNDVIVLSKEESSIVKPGESIVYQLFGGQESTYTVGLYVNNQLVTDAFDGKPYVEIKTKADTVSSITVDIDSLQLKNNDCISFIAIPKEVSERELYKSVNITYIESNNDNKPNSGTISTGELLDITDGKVWLVDAIEKNGQTYVIYSENKKAKLGTYKNGKISDSVEIEGSRVDIFDKGCEKIGIISQKRFGIIEKLAVYNNSLEKINEAEFSDDSGITSICLSKNGDSYFVSYDKSENGEVFCVIETRNFSGEISEIGRFSSYEKDNPDKPFSIEVISQINENELFCKGFYLKAGSDDGIPCYGVVDIQSGNFKSVSSGKTRGYQAIKNGFVLYDEALEYSMTSSGKAEIYICDNAEVFTFSTPNESQRVMLSQNGKYIVTNRTEYSKDTPEKTTLRVYDVTTHKLLTENVMDESKYHFNGTIFISENERQVLISAFDDSDNSYIFRVDF